MHFVVFSKSNIGTLINKINSSKHINVLLRNCFSVYSWVTATLRLIDLIDAIAFILNGMFFITWDFELCIEVLLISRIT